MFFSARVLLQTQGGGWFLLPNLHSVAYARVVAKAIGVLHQCAGVLMMGLLGRCI
jgi:hypothetical protein